MYEQKEIEREKRRDSPGNWQCVGVKAIGADVLLQAARWSLELFGVVERPVQPDWADRTVLALCGLCLLVRCRANRI